MFKNKSVLILLLINFTIRRYYFAIQAKFAIIITIPIYFLIFILLIFIIYKALIPICEYFWQILTVY